LLKNTILTELSTFFPIVSVSGGYEYKSTIQSFQFIKVYEHKPYRLLQKTGSIERI